MFTMSRQGLIYASHFAAQSQPWTRHIHDESSQFGIQKWFSNTGLWVDVDTKKGLEAFNRCCG